MRFQLPTSTGFLAAGILNLSSTVVLSSDPSKWLVVKEGAKRRLGLSEE